MAEKQKLDGGIISIMSTNNLRINKSLAAPVFSAYNAFIESAKTGHAAEQIKENKKRNSIEVLKITDFDEATKTATTQKMSGRGLKAVSGTQANSIAVIPVNGILMRETYYQWGSGYVAGTRQLEDMVKICEATDGIVAVVFRIGKCPGGEGLGAQSLGRAIAKCSKPTLYHFDGIASAGVEAFLPCDEGYANEKMSYFGSVGTYTTFSDWSKYYEDLGVVTTDVYADGSELKNIETREAKEGRFDKMKEQLNEINDDFVRYVKMARSGITDDGQIYKGKLYSSSAALNLKAIDGIRDFDYVINRAAVLARRKNTNFSRTMKKVENADGTNPDGTKTVDPAVEKTAATATETAEAVSFFRKFSNFFAAEKAAETTEEKPKPEGVPDVGEVVKLSKQIGKLEATIEAKDAEITKLQKSFDDAAAILSGMKDDVLSLKTANVIEGEKQFDSVKSLVDAYNATFEHNKALGGNGKAPNLPAATQEAADAPTVKTEKTFDEKDGVRTAKAKIEKRIAEKKAARKQAAAEAAKA